MNQKLLFLDLDDTLLNSKKEITPGNRTAIHKALSMGHKVIICTGRPLSSAIAQAKKLDLTEDGCLVISFNGALIYDMFAEKLLYHQPFDPALLRPIFDEGYKRGLYMVTYDADNVLVEPCQADWEETDWYYRRISVAYRTVEDVSKLDVPVYKVLAVDLNDVDNLLSYRDWLLDKYGKEVYPFHTASMLLEICTAGINKGSGIEALCDILGLSVEDTIACGDAENDIEMIQTAGIGVAMANAYDEVKAVADYITENDCDHDAIAEVIYKFMVD